ncbi:MAG: recombination-associated protein RdgC [Alcanivoracaceae bacterium]|nr:recombination-associated protein RdgC [Alcanivoracaceae bacterium]
MWFKNLQTYKFDEKFPLTAEELTAKLELFQYKPCTSMLPKSIGFVAPISKDTNASLVHAIMDFFMICLAVEEKIVPSGVVKQELEEKIALIEKEQSRKVYKKEKDNLQEEIYQQLLPRAFSKKTFIFAYIDKKCDYLVVNTASSSKAEDTLVFLRKALGSLKVSLLETCEVGKTMTNWILHDQYPAELVISDSCVLKDHKEHGGTIRCQKQNILAKDIKSLMEESREVKQLSLIWQDKIAFNLKTDFSITSMKFLELIQDQAKDTFTETAQAKFDADFGIMSGTLREFLNYLSDLFAPKNTASHKDTAQNTKSTMAVE